MGLIIWLQHKPSNTSQVYSGRLVEEQTEKRPDNGRRQETFFFLLSKLCRISHCWLVAVVNEGALFVEHKLRKFMGEVARVIVGRMFFLKFWEMSLLDLVLQEWRLTLIFSRRTVISLVRSVPTVPVSEQDVIEATYKELSEAIYFPWVYDFCHHHNITNRIWTGNKSLSPAQVAINNKCLSYRLGRLKRSYYNGLDESTVENFDETYIVVDMDNGLVLKFQGWNRVTDLDVASGRDCFTVCMRSSGGKNTRIEKPLVIFQKRTGTILFLAYPIMLTGLLESYFNFNLLNRYSNKNILRSPSLTVSFTNYLRIPKSFLTFVVIERGVEQVANSK